MSLIISIIMTGLCVAALGFAWARQRERVKIWKEGGFHVEDEADSLVTKYVLPISRGLKDRTRRFTSRRGIMNIRRRVAAAGMDELVDVETVVAARVLLAGFFTVFGTFVFPFGALASAIAGFLTGWNAPEVWLKLKARKRREDIEFMLPGALDWLALSVEAGMDLAQALQRVTERARGPLKTELTRLNFEIGMGIPRREALLNLSRRAMVPALKQVLALVAQADALGVSIGPVLKSSARRLRFLRFTRAEKKGMLAQQVMLLPLVLLIMPATFVVIFGPIIVKIVLGGVNALF